MSLSAPVAQVGARCAMTKLLLYRRRGPWRTALDAVPLRNVACLFAIRSEGPRMLRRKPSILLFFLFFALPVPAGLVAQTRPDPPDFDVREHYTKYEYRIPMRDGVHLFTAVYVPKDSSQAYPFLINRTPYSVAPYG